MGIDRKTGRAVFLDRDGVINRALVRDGRPYPPSTLAELEILPDVPAALASLKRAGFRLIVVTNQPDVARGTQRREIVDAMHTHLAAVLPLDEFRVCDHDGDACGCRKPKPGMLIDAAREHGIALERSYLVGDRWRDIEAGRRAGCSTIFIDRGYDERRPDRSDAIVASLEEAADWILARRGVEKAQ
jgi:D-glycero-D-manno-heptose 1,7-bisphosphate phosphatase